ncbi:MAG: N-acetylmuramoyl-L-alanine amidase [Planctomycetota bacterium]
MKASGFFLAAMATVGFQVASAQSAPPMRYVPARSSNYTARSSRTIDRIVIHTIEGSEAGAISWFQNSSSRVSAHYVNSHAGRITRMMRDSDVAWHCRDWNYRAIGIENEGYAYRNTWTDAQMRSLAALVAYLCKTHGIPVDRTHIVGHVEVPGNTHTDPGPYFDWNRLISDVRALRNGGTAPTPRPTPAPAPSAGVRGVQVTAASLNVRTAAWGTVLGAVRTGQRFVLTGQSNGDWREIFYSGRRAWVHAGYLQGASGAAQEVTASSLNVRSGASTSNGALGLIHNGERYFQTGSSGAWRQLQLDSRTGWSHGDYLRAVTAQP